VRKQGRRRQTENKIWCEKHAPTKTIM
jgi:hypothetical protein